MKGEDRLSLYRKLGQAQERSLDVTAALATWQKMTAEFPKDQFALDEAGAAELDAGQYDEAKNTFQKLVDLTEPNSMNRVQALMKLADVGRPPWQDGRRGPQLRIDLAADRRLELAQPRNPRADRAGLPPTGRPRRSGRVLPKNGRPIIRRTSRHCCSWGATQTELGKTGDALNTLRKVTVLAPDRHEVRQSFAEALVQAKQYDEAITVLTALTADDPTEPRYWARHGRRDLAQDAAADAGEQKGGARCMEPHRAARLEGRRGDYPGRRLVPRPRHERRRARRYQRALKLTPDASDIREKAVKLLVDMNRKDEAWKLLDAMADGSLATAGELSQTGRAQPRIRAQGCGGRGGAQGLAIEPGNFDLMQQQWNLLAEDQKWTDCVAMFDKLVAAAPNPYFIDQIEARHVQALGSAGKLEETEKRLHEKLGATPGLNEGELRLLLRIMTQNSEPDVPKAIEEARRRFPQSLSLARIEIDYERHQGNFDGAVAALQRLIETTPLQKNDWLAEMIHVRQDQGNLDEALRAADQLIAASPTGADGYLLYADIAIAAGKADQAVAKLQAAVKLSDKPNDVRQRLARFYLENGQPGKARAVYDDAFAAAENPQDKLTIVRAMTPAYFQDGQIDALVGRFKKEQASEESGWRYGLYLAAIYEQMNDFGAARQELAKSLAVRPQDTGLLRSLIGLAEKEADFPELLKYRQALAQADPSATNEIALANEYATQGKAEEAWQVVQKNLGEVAKDPLAWKDVLSQISDPDYAQKGQGRARGRDPHQERFVRERVRPRAIPDPAGRPRCRAEDPLGNPCPPTAACSSCPECHARQSAGQSPLWRRPRAPGTVHAAPFAIVRRAG